MDDQVELMTPSEVANLFRVDPKTVTRWAQAGKLPSIRTLGGHRRYKKPIVMALLGAGTTAQDFEMKETVIDHDIIDNDIIDNDVITEDMG